MKKSKILSFLLIFSIFTGNANALTSKKAIQKTQFYVWFFTLLDQANKSFIPDDHKFNYWPETTRNFQKHEKMQFDAPHDTNISLYVPTLANRILLSSIDENEGFLSMLLNGFIRVQNLEELVKNKTDQVLTDLKKKEGIIVASEKICEIFTNDILNNTIRDSRVLKRLLKIFLFTAIATSGAHLRRVLSEDALTDHMPKLKTTALNKLIEMLIVETSAELIKRYLITDTIKEKKKKLKQKHQAIFSNQISSLVKKKKEADYLEEEEEERTHFLCSPA